jgi:hypothetical protein
MIATRRASTRTLVLTWWTLAARHDQPTGIENRDFLNGSQP